MRNLRALLVEQEQCPAQESAMQELRVQLEKREQSFNAQVTELRAQLRARAQWQDLLHTKLEELEQAPTVQLAELETQLRAQTQQRHHALPRRLERLSVEVEELRQVQTHQPRQAQEGLVAHRTTLQLPFFELLRLMIGEHPERSTRDALILLPPGSAGHLVRQLRSHGVPLAKVVEDRPLPPDHPALSARPPVLVLDITCVQDMSLLRCVPQGQVICYGPGTWMNPRWWGRPMHPRQARAWVSVSEYWRVDDAIQDRACCIFDGDEYWVCLNFWVPLPPAGGLDCLRRPTGAVSSFLEMGSAGAGIWRLRSSPLVLDAGSVIAIAWAGYSLRSHNVATPPKPWFQPRHSTTPSSRPKRYRTSLIHRFACATAPGLPFPWRSILRAAGIWRGSVVRSRWGYTPALDSTQPILRQHAACPWRARTMGHTVWGTPPPPGYQCGVDAPPVLHPVAGLGPDRAWTDRGHRSGY